MSPWQDFIALIFSILGNLRSVNGGLFLQAYSRQEVKIKKGLPSWAVGGSICIGAIWSLLLLSSSSSGIRLFFFKNKTTWAQKSREVVNNMFWWRTLQGEAEFFAVVGSDVGGESGVTTVWEGICWNEEKRPYKIAWSNSPVGCFNALTLLSPRVYKHSDAFKSSK